MNRNLRSQRGGAAVEFAVILPVFLLFALATVDFGRAFWTKNALANVAREATRYASVRSQKSQDPATETKVAGLIIGQAGPLDPDLIVISTTWVPSNSPGSVVQVSVSYDFEPIFPLLAIESITLASSSQMIISY